MTWAADIPAEVRAAVEPLLPDALRFAPRWLVSLEVVWKEDETDSILRMGSQPQYRDAALQIGPQFLGAPARERVELLRHEILHATVQPLYAVIEDVAEACGADGPVKELALKFADRALEGVVCDLEIMLRDLAPVPSRGS